MAFDSFLKIDGVDGESTRKGFEKQMEILSFSWGASNPSTVGAGGGGGGGGKVSVSSFSIMKSERQLRAHCCSRPAARASTTPRPCVTLNKAAGKAPIDFIKYEFERSLRGSASSGPDRAGGDDTPTESVSFSFGKVTITYTPQKRGRVQGQPSGRELGSDSRVGLSPAGRST